MFALNFTVITAYTDIIITGKSFFHIFQLVKETFLSSENIKIMILNHFGDDWVALSPTVSVERIVAVGVS